MSMPLSALIAAARRYDLRHSQRSRKINSPLALSLYQTGASDPEISAAAGICRRAVKSWRDARGLPPNRSRGGHAGVRRLSDADKAEALRMLHDGRSPTAVAARFGMQRQALEWHRRRARQQL